MSVRRPGPVAPRRPVPRRGWRSRVLVHRRPLAFLCATGAVLAGLAALAPDERASVEVVVAARDLPAGIRVEQDDVRRARLPPDAVPAGLVPDPVGDVLASPLRRGEPVTDLRLSAPTVVEGHPGRVGLSVRLVDPATAELLRPGDEVDLLSVDPGREEAVVVATDARVLAAPTTTHTPAGTAAPGQAVLVGVRPHEVGPVSIASAAMSLSVAFSP